jgi:predicted enzyme related to lactoylglutathione lyase
MLKQIKFIAVPVKDQSRALAFYTEKLGLRVFTDQTMGQMRWIELQIPGAETMLVLHHKSNHVPNEKEPAVAFVADDVKATYEQLRARGVEFTQPPKKEHWGEHAMFKDSEGNLLLFSKA